jgi:hypothetical protein
MILTTNTGYFPKPNLSSGLCNGESMFSVRREIDLGLKELITEKA